MLSTGIFVVLQDPPCLSITVVVSNSLQYSQDKRSSTYICPYSLILQWSFELTLCIKDRLWQELTSLYIANSSMSWQSWNFSSHLTGWPQMRPSYWGTCCPVLPTEIVPLCLLIWILVRWETGKQSSRILHQHHSQQTSSAFPLIPSLIFAMQNRSGLVVSVLSWQAAELAPKPVRQRMVQYHAVEQSPS